MLALVPVAATAVVTTTSAGVTFNELLGNLHGLWATLSLVFFGAGLALLAVLPQYPGALRWLKGSLIGLFALIVLTTLNGIWLYVPYRAAGGARGAILESARPWVHTVIFEHKEFVAYAPWLLVLVALGIVWAYGATLGSRGNTRIRLTAFWTLALALVLVLLVSAEAVIVTKFAPVS